MKNLVYLLIAGMLISACTSQTSESKEEQTNLIVVKNTSEFARTEVISIPTDDLELAPGIYTTGDMPVEAVDLDNDIKADKLLAKVMVPQNQTIEINLSSLKPSPEFTKQTQAEISRKTGGEWVKVTKKSGKEQFEYSKGEFENVDFLRVPEQHTDHSWFIRYEGPGWENELIAYRAYLDWRNAIDIFGKKVDTLVLQKIGQDGFDSYHEDSPWGMDILKAGKSLGIGSIGRLNGEDIVEHFESTDSVTCEITRNGFLSSSIETNYYGWTTGAGTCDVKSILSIKSADYATIHQVSFDTVVDDFVTGIVKHDEGEYFTSEVDDYGYIATYGKQTLFNDNLGMAIVYKKSEVQEIKTDDDYSWLVVFNPSEKVEYQLLGAWEKDLGNISSKTDFKAMLDRKLASLNNPLEVVVN